MVSFLQIFSFFLIFSGLSCSIFLEFLPGSKGHESRLSWKFRENLSKIRAPGRVLWFFDSYSACNRDRTPKFTVYDLRRYLSGEKRIFKRFPLIPEMWRILARETGFSSVETTKCKIGKDKWKIGKSGRTLSKIGKAGEWRKIGSLPPKSGDFATLLR